MDVQSHLQQILGLHKDIPNGEGHSSLPGNIAGADSNSVHSMVSRLYCCMLCMVLHVATC